MQRVAGGVAAVPCLSTYTTWSDRHAEAMDPPQPAAPLYVPDDTPLPQELLTQSRLSPAVAVAVCRMLCMWM
jgi:hypothetical protein